MLFFHRDLILKYCRDIFVNFLYCYIRYFILMHIKSSIIYGFYFLRNENSLEGIHQFFPTNFT